MAKKPSKSILSGLKNMLHREPEKKPEPAKKAPTPAQKKPAAPAPAAKEQRPAAPAEPSAPADAATSQTTPDKKKVKNQPWYRHRQRW